MATWNVFLDHATPKHPGAWVLEFFLRPLGTVSEKRMIDVGPITLSWEQAVDASLEFLDRLRTGAIPKSIDDPRELMEMCVRNMRRQH